MEAAETREPYSCCVEACCTLTKHKAYTGLLNGDFWGS